MKFLREKMGPEIQTYTESDCDVMLIYSGVYDYVVVDEKTGGFPLALPMRSTAGACRRPAPPS